MLLKGSINNMIPTVWVGNRLRLIISKNLWNSYTRDTFMIIHKLVTYCIKFEQLWNNFAISSKKTFRNLTIFKEQ